MPRQPDCQWCGGKGELRDRILLRTVSCGKCGGTGADPSFDLGMAKYEQELADDHEQYVMEKT